MTDSTSTFTGWNFLKAKEGGANESGEYGGVYESLNGAVKAMIKKEPSIASNISEFLGSTLFEAISPGNGAKVSLIAPNNISIENKSSNTDDNIYVKSEFFKDYSSDMYVDMDKNMSPQTKFNKFLRKNNRPLVVGSRNIIFGTLDKAFIELKYQGFEKIMPASLLINDFDVHTGNIGIIRDPNNSTTLPQMVRIDFGGSLNKLTEDIYPNSRIRHLPGRGPTNHFREFPSHLRRRGSEFADSLLAASKVDLDDTIDNSFAELSKYYSNEAIISWVKHAMPHTSNNRNIVNDTITIEEIKDSFKGIMKVRQKSLKDYGLSVKLSSLVTKTPNKAQYEINEAGLKKLVQEYLDDFNKIIQHDKDKVRHKRFELSDKKLRGNRMLRVFRYLLDTLFPRLNNKFKSSIEQNLLKKVRYIRKSLKQAEIPKQKFSEEVMQELRKILKDRSAKAKPPILKRSNISTRTRG